MGYLEQASHLVVVSRVERNRELSGLPGVALGCLEMALGAVAPPDQSVVACVPFPYLSPESVRKQTKHTGVLPGWLSGFWSSAGFVPAADPQVWLRTFDSPMSAQLREALVSLGVPAG